jgi:hypothetical protein
MGAAAERAQNSDGVDAAEGVVADGLGGANGRHCGPYLEWPVRPSALCWISRLDIETPFPTVGLNRDPNGYQAISAHFSSSVLGPCVLAFSR